MNWTAASIVIELVGVIVVVVTLWYVAIQIRQNTNALVASTRQGLLDADLGLISDFIEYGIDPHLIGDDIELSDLDERRFTWIVIKAIRVREFAWHQYHAGNLDEETFQSYMAPVPGIFSTERARAILKFYTGSEAFLKILKEHAGLS